MAQGKFWQERPPLVGRDDELVRLQAALDEVMAGMGQVVLISGEPGIGKTRLVEELAALAVDQGAVVVSGRVDDVDGAPPYWPWVQSLDSVLLQVDHDVLGEALVSTAASIAAIVPAVKEFVAEIVPPPPLEPAAARFRLYQAVVEFLGQVSGQRRLMLVLEDMHWADVASLELTRFLAPRLPNLGVLLVVTYRNVDAGRSAPLHDVLGSLARLPRLTRVALNGLTEPEVGRFMAQTIGIRARPVVVASVYARTDGNPFFVGELARLMQCEGRLGAAAVPAPGAVPVGVRDVIRRRLVGLPELTNELLVLGAVIGCEFDLATLAAVADRGDVDTLDGIEPAIGAGLVSEEVTFAGKVRFSHALIRDTVYGELSSLRRATLHAQVGMALERDTSAASRVSELAGHFFHAAPVVGPERGLGYLLAAAEAAQAALAFEQAEDDLRRGLSLIALLRLGVSRLEHELQIQNRLMALLILTRGHAAPEVGVVCARARQLCQEIGASDDMLRVLSNLAGFHSFRGELSVLEEFAGQILTIGTQSANPLWLTWGYQFLGVAQVHTGRLAAARDTFRSVRAFAGATGMPTAEEQQSGGMLALPMGLGFSALTAWLLGEESEALAFAREGFELASRLGHPPTLAYSWLMHIHILLLTGNDEVVLEESQMAMAFCDEHGLIIWRDWLRIFRGWAICHQGRAEEGVAEMAVGVAVNQACGARINTPIHYGLLADCEASRGEFARALALIDEALAVSGENRLWESDLYRLRGEVLVAQDTEQGAEAAEWLRRAISVAAAQGAVPFKQRAEAALRRVEQDEPPRSVDLPEGGMSKLSPREVELLTLVGRGLTDKEAAAELVVSVATVRSHLDRIRDKTGRRRRPELTRLAVDLGLISY